MTTEKFMIGTVNSSFLVSHLFKGSFARVCPFCIQRKTVLLKTYPRKRVHRMKGKTKDHLEET